MSAQELNWAMNEKQGQGEAIFQWQRQMTQRDYPSLQWLNHLSSNMFILALIISAMPSTQFTQIYHAYNK